MATEKTIAQWASSLVNEANVKVCVILIPDTSNPNADPTSGWIIYSGG
jgi:hypothetical protein